MRLFFTTRQWKNFWHSVACSCLKASKADIQGLRYPYPSPIRALQAMPKPTHKPNKAGNARAPLRNESKLLLLTNI